MLAALSAWSGVLKITGHCNMPWLHGERLLFIVSAACVHWSHDFTNLSRPTSNMTDTPLTLTECDIDGASLDGRQPKQLRA